MSLCRYVAMCPPLRLATRRRTSLDCVVLVSSCTLYFVGKLNYCCGWKINSIHNTWADRWCECARWLKDVWLYEQNECMSVRTRRCPVERVGLMRGDDTPATTAGTLHQSQPVPNIIKYIDIMQLAFREGRSKFWSYFYSLLSFLRYCYKNDYCWALGSDRDLKSFWVKENALDGLSHWSICLHFPCV